MIVCVHTIILSYRPHKSPERWKALNLMCQVVVWVQVYMLEIYQDSLIDLLLPKNAGKQRKLEIKKDSKVIHTHCFQVCIIYLRMILLAFSIFCAHTSFEMCNR